MPRVSRATDLTMGLHRTSGPEETISLGSALARELQSGDIILLRGELGGGKTHFVKGIAQGLGHRCYVKSPSFTIVNIYGEDGGGNSHSNRGVSSRSSVGVSSRSDVGASDAPLTLYHMDLYRIGGSEIFDLGLEEYLYGDGVSVVEWAEKAPELTGEARFVVSFTYVDESLRDIKIEEKCFR